MHVRMQQQGIYMYSASGDLNASILHMQISLRRQDVWMCMGNLITQWDCGSTNQTDVSDMSDMNCYRTTVHMNMMKFLTGLLCTTAVLMYYMRCTFYRKYSFLKIINSMHAREIYHAIYNKMFPRGGRKVDLNLVPSYSTKQHACTDMHA